MEIQSIAIKNIILVGIRNGNRTSNKQFRWKIDEIFLNLKKKELVYGLDINDLDCLIMFNKRIKAVSINSVDDKRSAATTDDQNTEQL